MTPEEFRKHGYQVIDWIADYLQNVERYPVLSQVAPGAIRQQLPAAPPRAGRIVRRHLARRGRHPHAGHYPLAVTELLRVLSGQSLGALDSR